MYNLPSGRTVDVKCSEMILPEFPNILFGNTNDGGKVFDATFYISSKNQQQKKNFVDFQKQLDYLIKVTLEQYDIKVENAFYLNNEGHILIDSSLCYIFISYVEPDFWVWANERLNELMHFGIATSDSYIVRAMVDRFSPEVIKEIYKQHGSNSGELQES